MQFVNQFCASREPKKSEMTFEILHSTCNALRDRTMLTIRKEVDTELAPFRLDIEHIRAYNTCKGWVKG